MIRKRIQSGAKGTGLGQAHGWRAGVEKGFTMIELMVVIAIIAILASLAVVRYEHAVMRAKEAVLRQDLFTLRSSIDQYTLDKQKAPQSLDDLVTAGYIKAIPKDPITNATDTWVTEQEDSLMAADQTSPGIVDVHSGSDAESSDGTAYSSW